MICERVGADAGLFYRLYDRGGARYMGDVQVAGPGRADVPVANVVGRPVPRGSAGSTASTARWRKGYWDARTPLRAQRNHFVPLDADIDRDVFMRTPVWPEFYEPGGLDDHLRALVYDGDVFVGWIGVFRQGSGARFTEGDRRALERLIDPVRALVAGASRFESEQPGVTPPCYAILDADGRCEHATETACALLDRERLQVLAGLVRGLDAGSVAASPTVFWGGVELRVVRLDGEDGVRYLAVIDRAAVPRLSVLHRMTPRQRAVAEYAAAGATLDEIARALGIGRETAKSHLERVYRVLEVASRAELAELWSRA